MSRLRNVLVHDTLAIRARIFGLAFLACGFPAVHSALLRAACDDATMIDIGAEVAGSTVGLPPGNTGEDCDSNDSPAEFFRLVGTGELIFIESCGSDYDTVLSLYTGECEALECVLSNDDACRAQSRLEFVAEDGVEYVIRLGGFADDSAGNYILSVLRPLPNDRCEDAEFAAVDPGAPAVITGSTVAGSGDADVNTCVDDIRGVNSRGVWYRVEGTGGRMTASTCSDASFDTRLAVFGGACGELVCIAANDDTTGCEGFTSFIEWDSSFDEEYLILVHGFNNNAFGTYTVTITGEAPPCIVLESCAVDQVAKTVDLSWDLNVVNATGIEISLDGSPVVNLPAEDRSFTHSPELEAGGPNTLIYEVRAIGVGEECSATCRVVLSPGAVCLSEDFDGFADDAELAAAGWMIVDSAEPIENASWTVTNPGLRAAPPTSNGTPSSGAFLISDSDFADGANVEGSGMSHDIVTPGFSAAGKEQLWLHCDVSAQLNNDGSAVFDIDVSTDDGATWTNAFRRVAPSRVGNEPVVTRETADGYFGSLDVDLSAAAGAESVRLRIRHFEPTDDWWIAVDNVLIDDVPPLSGGNIDVLPLETFDAGIPDTWMITGFNAGTAQGWSLDDLCSIDQALNGAAFPHAAGRGVHHLEAPYPLIDSDCDPDPAESEMLRTPVLDLSAVTRVFLHYDSETVVSGDTQQVLVSLDGGESFQEEPLFDYLGGGLFDRGEDPFFAQRVIEVPAAAGKSAVVFAFFWAGANDWYWGIDNVRVSGVGEVSGGLVIPGDANLDGRVDLSDGIAILEVLFLGSEDGFPCGDSLPSHPANVALLDWQPDGLVNLSDAVALLNFLFGGGPAHALAVPGMEITEGITIEGCPDAP